MSSDPAFRAIEPTVPAPPRVPSVEVVDDGERVPPTLEGIADAMHRLQGSVSEIRVRTVALESAYEEISRDANRTAVGVHELAAGLSQVRGVCGELKVGLDRAAENYEKRNGLTGCLALVVDDSEPQRRLVADVLTSRGAVVMALGTLCAAQEILDQIDPCIAILDLSLGGETEGLELAGLLREKKPRAGIVITSGHFDEHGRHGARRVNERIRELELVILPKPQTLDSIVSAAVRARALHAARGRCRGY